MVSKKLSLEHKLSVMKKYGLVLLAGLFAVGTVTAAAIGSDKGKKKKKVHSCCEKGKSECKKDMKNCAKM
jgi:hypothetical protein